VKMCHFHMSCDAYVLFSYKRKKDMSYLQGELQGRYNSARGLPLC